MTKAALTLADFVRAATGKPSSELSEPEFKALEKIYRWGPGPEQAIAYRKTHKLGSWAEMIAHIEGLKP